MFSDSLPYNEKILMIERGIAILNTLSPVAGTEMGKVVYREHDPAEARAYRSVLNFLATEFAIGARPEKDVALFVATRLSHHPNATVEDTPHPTDESEENEGPGVPAEI